jgi:uncharacterized protein (DUF1501 family)
MKRREFIRRVLPATAALAMGSTLTFPLIARAAGNKRLIVVFQRGGCDGLNAVVPYGDDDYYNLRPTLAISPPSAGDTESAVSIDNDLFALHPALSPLVDIYQQGDMAIMPSVHFGEATRSHFANQELLEKGADGVSVDGWLNRYIQLNQGGGELPVVSIGPMLAQSLRGSIPVSVINKLSQSNGLNDSRLASITAMYEQSVSQAEINRAAVHASGRLMLEQKDTLSLLAELTHTPGNGAVYPASEFGAQLQQLALVIKNDMGLEIATISINGWDTHRNQGGATGLQADSLADFAQGIAALHTDLGPAYMQDTLILTMTEFGRTAKENASEGTDHGHASAWYAIGGGVNGGIHGLWPGLSDQNLHQGNFLAQTVDCRDIISEVIAQHLGQSSALGTVMPGHFYQPVGFL